MLFQKCVVRTKFDIYVFIIGNKYYYEELKLSTQPLTINWETMTKMKKTNMQVSKFIYKI